MTSERSKRRDFLSLIFISKSISKKLLIKINKVITFTFTTSTPLRSSDTQGSRLDGFSRRVGKIIMIISSVFEIKKEK